MSEYYTTEKLGPKREKTPEGFLILRDVPLARIGEQTYHYSEVPIPPATGTPWVKVLREPDQVFSPVSISSAVGKPFVILHPSGMEVTPDNFQELSAGHIVTARRGEGKDADVLLGDILVCRRDAIEMLDVEDMENAMMDEVSMGYDCAYDMIGDAGAGLGRQRDIIFNHVALVPQGRCGPRCSIGDRIHMEVPMARKTKDGVKKLLDSISALIPTGSRKAFDAVREDLEEEMEGKGGDAEHEHDDEHAGPGHHIEIHHHTGAGDRAPARRTRDAEEDDDKDEKKKTEDRFLRLEDGMAKIADAITTLAKRKGGDEESTSNEKILGELEFEAPPGTTDAKQLVKATDSAFMEQSYTSVVADAEILAPGMRVPTFDAKAKPAAGLDVICGIRRRALDYAMMKPEIGGMVEQVLGGRTLDTKAAPCGQIRTVFNSVVALAKARNNDGNTRFNDTDARFAALREGKSPIGSLADLNKANDAFKRRSNSGTTRAA